MKLFVRRTGGRIGLWGGLLAAVLAAFAAGWLVPVRTPAGCKLSELTAAPDFSPFSPAAPAVAASDAGTPAAPSLPEKWVCLTFDDGPSKTTPEVLATLDAAGVQLRVFDAKPLYHIALEHGGVGAAIVFDGKLAAYLLNPSASDYQAGQLAAEYAAAPAFACAAAPDAGALSALLDVLSTKLDEQGGHDLLATMELPLARVLADMERIGFAIDADGIRAFGDSLRSELDGILNNIYTTVGYSFNVNSPKQLGEALFEKRPRLLHRRRDTGKPAPLQPGH